MANEAMLQYRRMPAHQYLVQKATKTNETIKIEGPPLGYCLVSDSCLVSLTLQTHRKGAHKGITNLSDHKLDRKIARLSLTKEYPTDREHDFKNHFAHNLFKSEEANEKCVCWK